MRRLTLGAVAATVTLIAGVSLIEQVASTSTAGCSKTWSYLDASCGGEHGAEVASVIRPIRVIGIDRNAPVVIAKAAATREAVAPTPAEIAAPAPTPTAAVAVVSEGPARAEPSTDGAGRAAGAVADPQPAQLSEEELTFKAGAQHRPGVASAAKDEPTQRSGTAPRKATRMSKPARASRQVVELPDGRRVTVHRDHSDEGGGRRVRAAEAGRRYEDSFGGFFGERRSQPGLGGLY